MSYLLSCAIIGGKASFEIDIQETRTVGALKNRIKAAAETTGPVYNLVLYQVDIDVPTDEAFEQAMQQISQSTTCAEAVQDLPPNAANPMQKELINTSSKLSQHFRNTDFTKQAIHVLIKLPQGESIYPRWGAVADMILVP
jgi:hypothetical protein